MADEFHALIGNKIEAPLDRIERVLRLLNRYVVETRTQADITLRFAAKPRRANWPEDFNLSHDGESLLLTIHSASKSERDELIRDIDSALSQLGLAASLEPI